jgi:Fibronectin type III domain
VAVPRADVGLVGALAAGLSHPANLPALRMKVWSRIVIAAAGIAFGLSAASVNAASPSPAPPSAPRNFKAAAGDSQVTLTWSTPSTGAPITGYTVFTTPADFPRTNTTGTTLVATGLTNGTNYLFQVRAVNAAGSGQTANARATPHVIPPSAPTNLAASSGPAAGQITLSWTPPTSNGSAPNIAHYTVTVSPGGVSAQVDGQTTTYVAQNLADNVTYTFTVTATNSKNATGPAAIVYAPLPIGATIGLQPTAGGASTIITVTGQLFLKNEAITLYWDSSSHVAASVVTDDNGSFSKAVKPFAGDKPAVHKLCASVQPKPCANFTLHGTPTPTPRVTPSPGETPSPSPSPSTIPPASGARTGGGLSGLDFLTKPPFVFLPIIGILLLLGVLAYWFFSRRRTPYTPAAATVVHRATRPDYMTPFPPAAGPLAAGPAAAGPLAPGQPGQSAWESPVQTAWEQPPAHPLPEVPPAPFQPPAPPAMPPAPPAPAPQPPPPATPPAPVPQWPQPQPPPPSPPAAPPGPEPPTPTVWPAAPDEPPDLPQPSD